MSYFSTPRCLLKVCCNVPVLVTMTPYLFMRQRRQKNSPTVSIIWMNKMLAAQTIN